MSLQMEFTLKYMTNLNDIYQTIQQSNKSQYSIFFIERERQKGKVSYKLLKSRRNSKIGEEFRENAIEYTPKFLKRDIISYYDALSQKRGVIQEIAMDNIPYFSEIISSCNTRRSDSIKNPKELASKLWGYIVKIDVKSCNRIIYHFSKYTPSELIDAHKSFFQIKGATVSPINKRSTFSLNRDYHAIIMYDRETDSYSPMYIIKRIEFEEFFSFKDYYINYIKNKIPNLAESELIDDTSAFVGRCARNFQFALRLTRIIDEGKYKLMNKNKIPTMIKDRGLNIIFENGMMKYDKSYAEEILDLLDDNFLDSPLTNSKYRATGGKVETKKSE